MQTEQQGRRRVFFTSDWHVGHSNVLVYDKRPFRDLSHMHEVLIANYNATVGPDGLCYFLGDMGMGKSDVLGKVIERLGGQKILILGNHDKGATAMHRLGFQLVLNMAALEIGNQILTMTHCPLRGVFREDVTGMKGASSSDNWHGEYKHHRFSVPDFGQYHLHGHTHKSEEERTLGRQWDVGVRANKYRPVSLSSIESWISQDKKPG